jgi:hypothetical protein
LSLSHLHNSPLANPQAPYFSHDFYGWVILDVGNH